MKPWGNLGVVETIYEDEVYDDDDDDDDNSSNSPSLLSSPPSPLHSSAQAWSSAMGCKTDVLIHVQGTAFHLHKVSDLLGMTEAKGEDDSNLKQMTENYFQKFIAVNGKYAAIVFKSCLALLPEAETTSFLVSRCVEVMNLTEDSKGLDGYFDDVISLRADDFKIVAESMHQRFEYQDLLYRIVDFYLEVRTGQDTALLS
ncbi:hypothetical protein Godav_006032 [Gossypium davidsonii]|uniref:Uncharacterized protein n=1 Tax=Gossypium davidsonii TaxID=34287 RepID=A0A7J8S3X5_GOSDV|nr:hypothetical protein [Gossypium davidsonii]